MTGYTVHTGTSIKFSDGWDKVFAKAAKKKSPATKGARRRRRRKRRRPARKQNAKRGAR